MDELLSEKEQIDQMRLWWSQYGAYVIGGILVAIAGIVGFNHFESKRMQLELDASAAYEVLILRVADGDLDDAQEIANEIAASYSDTTYAAQASLAMARLYMDKNRDQDAADALLEVVNGGAASELKHVARLRLGRIYLYQGKAQETVELLEPEDNQSFAAAYGEVLGDAYAALGRVEDARAAYQAVLLDPLVQGTVDQQLVQWKSLDLPGAIVTDGEAEAEAEVEAEVDADVEADAEAEGAQ